jgi:endonuclease-3
LSAQCTDKRVNEITPILFSRAKTPAEMTQLTIPEILEIIRPCGLGNAKATAIWNLSKIILDKHKGLVPNTFEELEALPGIGHKTASCVMAHSFKVPAFPVDTHIHRLAKRFGLSSGKSVIQTETDLKALFPKSEWNKLHLQLIYYARAYCPARIHSIDKCPICKALQTT